MALACEPDLLIADEPTTALDVTIRQQVMELLYSIQRTKQMSILLITHDLPLVESFAERVGVMKNGEMIECERKRIYLCDRNMNIRDCCLIETNRVKCAVPKKRSVIGSSKYFMFL